jgi:uracil-DNA glycosylase
MTPDRLPADWRDALADEFAAPYFAKLSAFVAAERAAHTVYPPEEDVFSAFRATPLKKVKVLLLGQDPYHGPGQAHGMCFSVRPGVRTPPSLANMFRELHAELGCKIPNNGYLVEWAERGVLLLNAVLTVRAGEANSHKGHGWETFTDAVIRVLNEREKPVVFALWGGYAQKKAKLVTGDQHRVVKAAHPSPLSAAKFMGSKPFSAINAALEEVGEGAIDWQISDR